MSATTKLYRKSLLGRVECWAKRLMNDLHAGGYITSYGALLPLQMPGEPDLLMAALCKGDLSQLSGEGQRMLDWVAFLLAQEVCVQLGDYHLVCGDACDKPWHQPGDDTAN